MTNQGMMPSSDLSVSETSFGRIDRLRARMLRTPEICVQRAYWWTKSYMVTEGEPEIIRRAKALATVLEELPICINEDELIVGMSTSKERGSLLFPEIQWEYILKEAELFSSRDWDTFEPISKEDMALLETTLPYWRGKCTWDRLNAALPDDLRRLHGWPYLVCASSISGVHYGHETIDYERALTLGLNGVREEVRARLELLDLANIDDFKKYQFLQAAEISLAAGARLADRYAQLAWDMAAKEVDETRRAELEQIADICARVPASPARTFYEGLQSIWLIHIVLQNEAWGPGLSFGRVDQYLYPLLKQDLDNGTLTAAQARELLALFLIKANDLAFVTSSMNIENLAGFPTMVSITLGGVTPDGRDAVNDLSYLLLDAEEAVGLNAEEITIRVSKHNPGSFLSRAVDVSTKLRGKFKFISDDTVIAQLLSEGRPIEHARDYVLTGCFTPAVPGRSLDITSTVIFAPVILELALNNGVSRVTGEKVGLETGDPREFKSYEEVWDAFKRQVEFLTPKMIATRNIDTDLYAQFAACPFMSAFFKPCIDSATDLMAGGTAPYAREGNGVSGLPNVADSLAAVKKVVFDDALVDMPHLVDALDRNFDSEDRLLHALSAAPKFGNDDDYVDLIANDIVILFEGELSRHRGLCGARPALALATGTGHLIMGTQVGATPEGRRAGEPFAEGGISPHQGRNVSGPTATLRSVAKIDHLKVRAGSVLNMKFNPDALSDADKKEKFISMLRTYCETGGYHVQFNIVDAKTLRDAQENPSQYRDMLVRVATYSAKFVELSPRMQEDIIRRTEFQ